MTLNPLEWKVIPAPRSVRRQRGERDGAEAAARALAEVLAAEAARGWEFHRVETLPVEERGGLFGGRRNAVHALLIFRRGRSTPATAADAPPQMAADPDRAFAAALAPRPRPVPEAEPPLRAAPKPQPASDAPSGPRLGPADR